MELFAFAALISFRWIIQLTLARRGTLEGPRDFLTATLFVAYLTFLGLAWSSDSIQLVSVILLAGAVALRVWALAALRASFSNSVDQESDSPVITTGPYRRMRNPLLLAYWLELTAFALSFPLSLGACVAAAMFVGLWCAWHGHEDNSRFAANSSEYRKYMLRVGNLGLGLFFPSRARLFRWKRITFDTYAAYAFVGFLVAQSIALGYGVPMLVLVLVVPTAFIGAYTYWRITVRRSKMRYGFSFFGGMLSAASVAFIALALLGQLNATTLAGLAIAVASGHAIGRLGCIAHGCCTGAASECRRPYFVEYNDPQQRINRVHGTGQIYCAPTVVLEALGQILIAFAVHFWSRQAAVIWLIGYGSLRAIIQSIRAEAGDLTRTIPAAVLLIGGCFLGSTLVLHETPVWQMPPAAHLGVVTAVAMFAAIGFGLRIAPAPDTQDVAAAVP